MIDLPYSFLLAIAALSSSTSAQRWGRNRSWTNSWSSCPSLKGCRLVGNNRSVRNYLNDQEIINPGTYKLICDVNRGLISSVRLHHKGRTTKEYAAPYQFRDLKFECGDTTSISVSGHSWGRQCFSQDFTFFADCGPTCQGHYQCPLNAQPRSGVDCVESFNDCECKPGYSEELRSGLCIEQGPICSGYSCPANSSPVWGRSCTNSFDDCKCDPGFFLRGDRCVSQCDSYTCPSNSRSLQDRRCVRSFSDCACEHGYTKDRFTDSCVKSCRNDYLCPLNSQRIFGRDCLESFDDCECLPGYDRNAITQECELSCPNYECPVNGRPRDGRTCVSSFRDCRCNRGFRRDRTAEACYPFCPNVECPANSSPKPDVDCVRGFGDCKCHHGYQRDRDTKQCIARSCNYNCPHYSSPMYGRNCISSFDDCQCLNGFVKDDYQEICRFGAGGPRPAPTEPRVNPDSTPRPTPRPIQPTPRPIQPPPPTPAQTEIVPTVCEVQQLISLLDEAVATNKALLPQFLRLAFHDAGTFDRRTGVGGANGCLLTNELMRLEMENENLHLALEPLQVIRDEWRGRASAADLIQFAGLYSVVRQRGQPGMNGSKMLELEEFQWGREDEPNCRLEWTDNLPGFQPEEGEVDIFDIPQRCQFAGGEIKNKMMDRNGFTAREAVALIGAHTIGLTRHVFTEALAAPWVDNGGDDFTPEGPVFDNGFHDFLANDLQASTSVEFSQNRLPFNRDFPTWFQVESDVNQNLNHLDTDVTLAFPSQDLSVHPDFHTFTREFANNNGLFIRTFMNAYDKMSKLGNSRPLARSIVAPCASNSRVASPFIGGGASAVQNGVPYQLEIQSSIAEAEVKLQETASKNAANINYLTTPLEQQPFQ